jgi:hypothetical protein
VQRAPIAAVPSSMPVRFMPPGGWRLVVGVGEQAMMSIGPNKVLSDFTVTDSPRSLTLEGQLPVRIVAAISYSCSAPAVSPTSTFQRMHRVATSTNATQNRTADPGRRTSPSAPAEI